MSTAKAPVPETRPGRLDQVVNMLANRDAGGLASGEDAQKASHRRRKAQIPHRVIKTTERSRMGAIPVDSESDSDDDYHAAASRSDEPMDESGSRLNGHAPDNGCSSQEADGSLPEGTLVLQPEAAKDNSPYVGPEFGTTKSRLQAPATQGGDGVLNRTYKCTACSQQICSLTTATVKKHPLLGVLLCQSCYNFYASGEFDRDENGYDEQCRWCGQGGNLICCDFCKHSFCKSCIRKNLGRDHLLHVLDADKWKCLCCDPKPLAFLMQECASLAACITSTGASGGGSGAAAASHASGSSDAQSRRPARRSTKPAATAASNSPSTGAKTPATTGTSAADSRKTVVSVGKPSGNGASATNSKASESSKQSTTSHRGQSASSKPAASTVGGGGSSASSTATTAGRAILQQATAAAAGAAAARRGPSGAAASSLPSDAPIIVPLGIVPRAAIRGSRTTFPELVHHLTDSMMERIKKKLAGLNPSSDVKLLVEEVSPDELSAPTSVRRRRLYEVPWERLGFPAPPPEPMRAPTAMTTSGHVVPGSAAGTMAVVAPAASTGPAAADAPPAVARAQLPAAVGRLTPAVQRPAPPATGGGLAVPKTSSFLGQQPAFDSTSIAEIINKLKRRELIDLESTTNRFLHTLEQTKVNFTELRKEVHAIKQAKIRQNQEAPAKRLSQPPHLEAEVALHARIRAALLDHLQVVYQICLSSTKLVGEVASVAPAAAAAPPPPPAPADDDASTDEYIDLTDYEKQKKQPGGGSINCIAAASSVTNAAAASPTVGGASQLNSQTKSAVPSPDASAIGNRSAAKRGSSTTAVMAPASKTKRQQKAEPSEARSGEHVLVVDSDSNGGETAHEHAASQTAATSAYDTDGSKSEASCSSRRSTAKEQPRQTGKPGQSASSSRRVGSKPAGTRRSAGSLPDHEDDDAGDDSKAKANTIASSDAAVNPVSTAGERSSRALHGSGKNSAPSSSGEQPLGANDQARLELLGDLCSLSDGESDNDDDDDNDEDYLVSLTKSKQRLTSSKRSQSAANRDVRIAVKQQIRAEGGSGAEPSVLKPTDAAYVRLKLLNPLEIQGIRAELKLQSMSRASQARQLRDHPSEEIASRGEKELRSLSQLVVRVKPEPSSDDEVQQGKDDATSSFGDESQTEAGSKADAAAGGSADDGKPKRANKSSKKHRTANVSDTTGIEASSDDAEDESDDAASDVDEAVAASGEASAGTGTGDHDAGDSNKAALRSLLNEGLFDSSLEDTANSDSEEVHRPAKKRPRIDSNEEGGAVSDGDSGDSESRASGDAGSNPDAPRKVTHPLLKRRLPPGVGNSSSNGSGDGSPAAIGQGDNVVMSDTESALSAKENLPETSNMPRSTEDTAHHSDDSDSEIGHRASEERSGSSSASDDSDGGVCGVGDGRAGGTRKRLRLSSSSSSRAGAEHVRSYNAPKRRRRVQALDSSDTAGSSSGGCSDVDNALSEDEVVANTESLAESSQRRRKIRRLIEVDRLREETKAAAKAEEERRQRIRDKQTLYNQFVLDQSSATACQSLAELVLERGENGKALVSVDPELLSKLKPHQAEAVQFLWDCVIESVARVKSTGTAAAGSGAILAHCMGLGKTLTVITFLHTVLNHENLLSLRTALVICPLGTISSWASEWEKWQEAVDRRIHLFDMSIMKKNVDRAQMLQHWQKDGGVLVLGYEMYRTLVVGKRLKEKSMKETFTSALLSPGPDIIVCDEGHLLKNATTNINKSLVQARTQRRIVLTGTPLQNNLKEYFVMMDFVKPNLLGSSKEFSNRFIQPILNGQCKDSTPADVKLMKKRAHVLHEMLTGCVQRRDYSALTKYLPPKLEYIISVRLSKLQILLYERYLKLREGHTGTNASTNTLFADYQWLLKIWTHPWLLHLDRRRREAQNDSFIDDETTSEESSDADEDDDVLVQDSSDDAADVTWKPFRKKKNGKKDISDPIKDVEVIDVDADVPVRPEITGLDPDWWQFMVPADLGEQFEQSGKLLLLFEILRLSEEIGDKVLVFSQSLLTLDYIEDALETIDKAIQSPTGNAKLKTIAGTGRFVQNVNYFRLDGSVNVHVRTRACEKFNDPNNLDARLFLISTRAGGLGINLSSANRIVMLDASWNPSQDVQAIFRAYRFGQTKPCYVYRLLSQGSMEERIYERQVTKLSLSERVVDERQIERHFLASDLSELYNFTPYRPDDPNAKPKETPVLPKDRVLAEMLEGQATWIVSYHEHDSLLEDLPSEQLTEEERKIAWDEYKAEKERGYAGAAAASVSAAVAGPSVVPAAGRSQQAGTGPGSWPPKTAKDVDGVTQAIRLRLQSQGLTDEDELQKRTESILRMAILATYPRGGQMRPLAHVTGVSIGGGGGVAQQAQQAAMLGRQANMPAGAKVGTHFPGPQWPQHADARQFRGAPYGGAQQRVPVPPRSRQSPAAAAGSSMQELVATAQHPFRLASLVHVNPSTSMGVVPMAAFPLPASTTSASTQGSLSLGPLPFAPAFSSARLPVGPSPQQPKQMQPVSTTIVTMTNTGAQPHRGMGSVMGRPLGTWPPYSGEATTVTSGTGAIVPVAGTAPGAPPRVSSLPQQQYQSLPPNNSSDPPLPPKQ